jgi:hypothetical protein
MANISKSDAEVRWFRACNEQGWSDETQVSIFEKFIRNKGLFDEFASFAEDSAKEDDAKRLQLVVKYVRGRSKFDGVIPNLLTIRSTVEESVELLGTHLSKKLMDQACSEILESQREARKSVEEKICTACDKFWSVFAEDFPEIQSGDSQLIGSDEAAFGLWFLDDAGDNHVITKLDHLAQVHESFTQNRIDECVKKGAKAALEYWIDAGMNPPKSKDIPADIAYQLSANVRHLLWANCPYDRIEQMKERR